MCGNGYEHAYKVVRQSNSNALRGDWERIGGDFRKVIGEVESELDHERNHQWGLNLTEPARR